MNTVHYFPDIAVLSLKAAEHIVSLIFRTVDINGECSVFLAGGNTPRLCYQHMSRLLVSMDRDAQFQNKVHWFFGDERYVEKTHSDRNEKMIRETLFELFSPDAGNLHFWDSPPVSAAECGARYNIMLSEFFSSRQPDIAILGLGADGHTASLFPGSEVETQNSLRSALTPQRKENAFAVYIPSSGLYRLTVSALFLKRVRYSVFLVSGQEKHAAFSRLMQNDMSLPSAWVVNGQSIFFATNELQ
ncbi:MAG: 6-phosphogluconolactonase [Spirochaetales bacterium]|nr:6-phosphogluconolactonase [Spirochaetales bacterium]